MTEHDLAELRAWAAEVCGYKNIQDWECPAGCKSQWRPDQNDAQALEVLDEVMRQTGASFQMRDGHDIDPNWKREKTTVTIAGKQVEAETCPAGIAVWDAELEVLGDAIICNGIGDVIGGDGPWRARNPSRPMAILLACRAAWDAMKGAEHAAD